MRDPPARHNINLQTKASRGRSLFSSRLLFVRVLLVILLFPCLAGFDLTRHSVPIDQVLDGGPPKDGIPAIMEPKFIPAAKAAFVTPNDEVVGVLFKRKARAYPLKILNWHEVVNDAVAGSPLAVTYCPLTASAIVYKRKLRTKPLTLGVSGKLFQSNLLFYDKSTESLWSQIKGEAVAGPLTGQRLEALPSVVTTWDSWRKAHPDTLVLDVNTGYSRDYGVDPYQSYESSEEVMFPVSPADARLPPKERVLGLTINGADEAFPFSRLASAKLPLKVELAGQQVTVIFDAPTGTARAFLDGRQIPAYTGYWFAWAALHPKTAIWNDTSVNHPIPAAGSADAQGVYGFSGTTSQFGEDKRGVIGECIWIYDAMNRKQVTSGQCFQNKPGQFHVPLGPGRYVVRGPGGNRAVEIKKAQWVRVDSALEVPAGFVR